MTAAAKPGVHVEIKSGSRHRGWLVQLIGVIDETFDWKPVTEAVDGIAVLDLDGVTRITSYGIREWINAMIALRRDFFFIRCRPAIVSQFNMVRSFGGEGHLVSLYAPYCCPECGKEFEVLLDRRYHRPITAFALHEVRCPACSGRAEFDDMPETFFSYVNSAPPLIIPPAAAVLIDGDAAPRAPSHAFPLTITKEVVGQVTALWLSGTLDKKAHFKRAVDGLEGNVVVMMADLISVTDEGLASFKAFAETPAVHLHLARVPLPIARAFHQSPAALGRATVASVQIHFRCSSCGHEFDVNADPPLLRRAGDVSYCPSCHSPLAEVPPEDMRAIMALPLADAPAEVWDYFIRARGPGDESTRVTMAPVSRSPTSDIAPASRRSNPPSPLPWSPPSDAAPLSWRSDPADLPGRLNRYEVLRRIATGGMATVYLGRVVGAGGFERLVAIKIMLPHLAEDPAFVAMFLDEARLAARIRHANVVAMLDINETPSGLMMVMDYIEGVTVREIMGRLRAGEPTIPPAVTLRIVLDALAGLHAAHELAEPDGTPLQIVHRDVSPHNLLVGVDGITRVSDFGIAHAKTRLVSATKSGEVKGKIGYMAPEQVRSLPVDRRSDIYAMGVVLWELLTGERMFKGDSEVTILYAVLQGVGQSPTELNSAVPLEISGVCMRALSENPEERPPTAAVFAEQIELAAKAAGFLLASAREVADLAKRVAEEHKR